MTYLALYIAGGWPQDLSVIVKTRRRLMMEWQKLSLRKTGPRDQNRSVLLFFYDIWRRGRIVWSYAHTNQTVEPRKLFRYLWGLVLNSLVLFGIEKLIYWVFGHKYFKIHIYANVCNVVCIYFFFWEGGGGDADLDDDDDNDDSNTQITLEHSSIDFYKP